MANWEHLLIQDDLDRGAMADVLPMSEFLDERTFVTKAGYPGVVLKLDPVPYECLDPERIDQAFRAWEAVLPNLLFGEGICRVYAYWIKRSDPPVPARGQSAPVIAQAVTERLQYFESRRENLFSIEIYVALVYEIKDKAAPGFLSMGKGAHAIDARLWASAHILQVGAQGLMEGMSSVTTLQQLDKQGIFEFFWMLLNYGKEFSCPEVSDDAGLDVQAAATGAKIKGIFKLGHSMVRVLTLKTLPKGTEGHLLEQLYDVQCNMIICTEWSPVGAVAIDKGIIYRKRVTSKQAYQMQGPGKQSKGEALVHGGKMQQVSELEKAQWDTSDKNLQYGKFSLTVILYHEDAAVLRLAAGKATQALLDKKGSLVEQTDKSAFVAWLATIPGNKQYSLRSMKITSENCADMALIFAAPTGKTRNAHLRDEYLMLLENNHGGLYGLNLHVGGLGNTLIDGIPEAGKSYLTGALITHSQKYDPLTMILDISGGGYRHITERLGGSYVRLGDRSGARINPFCLEPTNENIDHLISFVTLLLESRGDTLSHSEHANVERQVADTMALPKSRRRLNNLALLDQLEERLNRWVIREPYGREPRRVGQLAYLFDNAEDTLTFSKFQTFDFPRMEQEPEAVEALLFYVLFRGEQLIALEPERPKFVWVDEAWEFLKHPVTKAFILKALKTWRKQNASIILATHTLTDLGREDDALLRALLEDCLTKLHLFNSGIDQEAAVRTLGMTKKEASLIAKLTPRRQILVQGQGIVNLRVDPKWHWLYANSPNENVKRAAAFAEHGVERGLEVLAGSNGGKL